MSRIPDQPDLRPGLTPKEALERLDRLRELIRPLEDAASKLCVSYDAELHRLYGYDFARPLPNGADSIAALDEARTSWRTAADHLVDVLTQAGL
jgi:hypothetical protein